MSQSYIPAELRRVVRQRAGDRCEYCLIPEFATYAAHEIDHVTAEKHGGQTVEENLALSCALCNGYKGSDLSSIDPLTGAIVPLYHPRHDRWADHYRLAEGRIETLTPVGRVTVRLLQLNRTERIEERKLLSAAGLL